MFAPRPHETPPLFVLRWTARMLGAISIGLILLFLFSESPDLSTISWNELAAFLLFPTGLLVGLILGWHEEIKGGSLALISIAAFYLVYGILLGGPVGRGWWLAIFAFPGFLFLLHGYLSLVKKRGHASPDD